MKSIFVIGSSNMDMVVRTKKIPAPGETVLGGGFMMVPGGKGANQAVAAAKLGAKVLFMVKLGKDVFGDKSVENFKLSGIDTSFVLRDNIAPSGTALIFVDDNGQNVIVVAPGANSELKPADVEKARAAIKQSACLVVQLEIPWETVLCAVDIANAYKVPVIFNPAPARKIPDSLLKKIDIINPNETETELITGFKVKKPGDWKKATDVLRKKGVKTAMITLGSKGVFVNSSFFTGLVQAFKVKAVDTTAAGDAFTGGLAFALASGLKGVEGIKYASAVAALSVTKMGAQSSLPTKKEVEKFLQ